MSFVNQEKKHGRKRPTQLEPRTSKRNKWQTSSSSHHDLLNVLKQYQEMQPTPVQSHRVPLCG
jgi:hypothetical protein